MCFGVSKSLRRPGSGELEKESLSTPNAPGIWAATQPLGIWLNILFHRFTMLHPCNFDLKDEKDLGFRLLDS